MKDAQSIRTRLLTDVDLATTLNIDRYELWDLDKAGHIPKPVIIGEHVRWILAEIEQWIDLGCPAWEVFERLCSKAHEKTTHPR